ncbi:MAG: nucleoside-diphosphate sugar epimerase/dehydratase [Acidobacteria bacterium]|nr:nucleoside-diphosphate sugar epimerase/dehydratase [Acidobacteriota bacterium]
MPHTTRPFGSRIRRLILLPALDLVFVLVAAFGANFLRFESFLPALFPHFWAWILLSLGTALPVFSYMGLYRGFWKYASINELFLITRAVSYRTVLLVLIFYGMGFAPLPRSIPALDGLLLFLLIAGSRFAHRLRGEMFSWRSMQGKKPVLIVGAGDAGEMILREMRTYRREGYNPVGLVDDDPAKRWIRIHGVHVLGGHEDLPRLIREKGVEEIILAIPSATGGQIRKIFEVVRDTGVKLRTVPALKDLVDGEIHMSQLREVELEDLLGRESIRLDEDLIRRSLPGRRVLITGGAGSIGRELSRQIAELRPARLTLVDQTENNLFQIGNELEERFPEVPVSCVIADILDENRLSRLFAREKPEVLFHAAAYKHVPMMEKNSNEAIRNNVLGTFTVASLAVEFKVKRFVNISTDKAVNPANVMGATKRLAELIVQSLTGRGTCFVSVRFGNVLGSDGSVVPTFKRQIAAGGPVTVTHPDIRRYFMTIPEAVQLVLQAGTMGKGGEIFILEMGNSVRIDDLARNLIELSGLKPGEDIEVVYTGLRPGEKMNEELTIPGEDLLATSNDRIRVLKGEASRPPALLLKDVEGLKRIAREGTPEEARESLRRILPEFIQASIESQDRNLYRFQAKNPQ